MKKKVVDFSVKEIDFLTQTSLDSVKGGKLVKNSLQGTPTSSMPNEPWVSIGVGITFKQKNNEKEEH